MAGRPETLLREIAELCLQPGTVRWSTRALAEHLGVSQSRVARALATTFSGDQDLAARRAFEPAWTPVEAHFTAHSATIVLSETRPSAAPGGTANRSLRIDAWRAFLLLELTREPGDAQPGDAPPAPAPAPHRPLPEPAAGVRLLRSRDVGQPRHGTQVVHVVHVVDQWGALLPGLVEASATLPGTAMAELLHGCRRWADGGRSGELHWHAPELTPLPPSVRRSTTVGALCEQVISGRLAVGRPFTASWLAARADVARPTVRADLVRLNEQGAVSRLGDRRFELATPSGDEVLEVYAARRLLGTLMLRRSIRTGGDTTAPAAALNRMREVVLSDGTQDQLAVADLGFQDLVAASSGAPRLADLFHGLTDQLRIFLAILGDRYAYAARSALADNEALLQALIDADESAAVGTWSRKMGSATGYMLLRLAPRRPGERRRGRPAS